MVQIAGATGPQSFADGNQNSAIGMANDGALLVNERRGRYAEMTKRGLVFNVASQAHVATSAGLATVYRGVCIANPITSNVKLELLLASIMQDVIQSTQVEAYAIAVGFSGTTNIISSTALTIRNNLVGSTYPTQATAFTSGTLPTAPFYHTFLTNTPSATTNAAGIQLEIAGRIILPPGGYAAIVTPGQAAPAGVWGSFDWAETPYTLNNAAGI